MKKDNAGQRLAPPEEDRGTVLDLLLRNAAEVPDGCATTDGDTSLTWKELEELVGAVALGLDDLGIGPEAVVGLHQSNRLEHLVADLAVLSLGATPFSVYSTLSPEQLEYVAGDSRMEALVVEAGHLPAWERARGNLEGLGHVVVIGALDASGDGVLPWSQLVARGRELLAGGGADRLVETRRTLRPDSPVTIVYTSGTTGPPKGAVLTNHGVRFVVRSMADRWGREIAAAREHQAALRDRDDPLSTAARQISYLPLAHGAERIGTYYTWLHFGSHLTVVRELDQLARVLPTVRPSYFVAVPRIWEKLSTAMSLRLKGERGLRGTLGVRALGIADEVGGHLARGTRPPALVRLQHRLFEQSIYPKLRAALGLDRCAVAISGAAPIVDDVLYRFAGLGVPIIEGYGLTECTAMATATTVGEPRPGSVGWTFTPEVEIRLADDGEILIRGPANTPGYLRRPEATAELIDEDGWLHTGDLGRFDADGALSIVGRKKELIINAAGKNMSPNVIEAAIKRESGLLAHVVPIGDCRPYNVALIVLDPDGLREWVERKGIVVVTDVMAEVGTLAQRSDLRADVEALVAAGNAHLSRVEQIKKFAIIDHFWTPLSPEVTPTMKVKRPVIVERYGSLIDDLYAD